MIRLLSTLFLGFCIATTMTIGSVFLVLMAKGMINEETTQKVVAALYGIDIAPPDTKLPDKRDDDTSHSQEQAKKKSARQLDIDLREQAIDQGLADLRLVQTQLQEEKARYNQLRDSFQSQLDLLQKGAKDSALIEVQRTLEVINPKQAKDHILRMLPADYGQRLTEHLGPDENASMIAVVTIIKAMPVEKRKKILAEFKTEEEAKKLAELLRQIRLGVPEVTLIGDTRRKIQEFAPKTPQ